LRVLVVGGSGGIGAALVRCYLDHPQVVEVVATWHDKPGDFSHSKLLWRRLDVTREDQIAALADGVPVLGRLINCVGVLHGAGKGPEKTVKSLDPAFFLQAMTVNTLPTLLLAKYFGEALKREQSVFAALSARVGSIGENNLGGWYSYRASKAALNMALKTLSREWRVKVPRCCVAALHPGTTDTPLSQPFQGNVTPDRLFTPERTARQLLAIIEGLNPELSGRFWSWDGAELPW